MDSGTNVITSRVGIDSKDELLYAMSLILEDTRRYFAGDTNTPSHTDGNCFHPHEGCLCCETDLTGDIDRVLSSPLIPQPNLN